jgi:hypothetical protein
VRRKFVGEHGFAEIKPHSEDGLPKGLTQLKDRTPANYPRFLLTYVPLGPSGQRAGSGKAAALDVYMVRFKNQADVSADLWDLRKRKWWRLGTTGSPPGRISFPPVSEPGAFGFAVEPLVRKLFDRTMLKPSGIRMMLGTGGGAPGSDVEWEFAEFYSQLAGELAEFYSELARELAPSTESFRF